MFSLLERLGRTGGCADSDEHALAITPSECRKILTLLGMAKRYHAVENDSTYDTDATYAARDDLLGAIRQMEAP